MNEPTPFSQQVRLCSTHLVELGANAITGLVDLTSHRLVRFSVTITHNQHDAEDAVQSVLVKISCDPLLLHRADDPWSYLLRMVRNESLLVARRTKRWNHLADLSDLRTHCLVDELEREESYRSIWLAMRKLPASQSEVVVLKIWESMTFAQIASILEVTPSTAASRYRYAMRKLASLLEQQVGESHHA